MKTLQVWWGGFSTFSPSNWTIFGVVVVALVLAIISLRGAVNERILLVRGLVALTLVVQVAVIPLFMMEPPSSTHPFWVFVLYGASLVLLVATAIGLTLGEDGTRRTTGHGIIFVCLLTIGMACTTLRDYLETGFIATGAILEGVAYGLAVLSLAYWCMILFRHRHSHARDRDA